MGFTSTVELLPTNHTLRFTYLMRLFLLTLLTAATLISNPVFSASIEDYGQLPTNRSMSISPNGEMIAWLQEINGKTNIIVASAETDELIKIVELGNDAKARATYFATDKYLIVNFSDTKKIVFSGNKFEGSAAYSFNIETGKISLLLRGHRDLYFAQSGLSTINSINSEDETVLMPAFDKSTNQKFNLYSVQLKNGKAKTYKKGKGDTFAWHVDSNGQVMAREDHNVEKELYRVYSYVKGKKPVVIYESDTDLPDLDIIGVNENKKTLVTYSYDDDQEYLTELSLETGEFVNNLFTLDYANIDSYITTRNDELLGLTISGLTPDYKFFDETTDKSFKRLLNTFKNKSIEILSYTKNFEKILISVSGSNAPENLYVFDSINVALLNIGSQFINIEDTEVADVTAFKYNARDGLALNAVTTWPKTSTIENRKNLPTLVFPHGGPASYDAITFDWWAQYFASQGYLVVQPNFRGSTGFGVKLTNAGYGKWGKEMQDDITDALDHLIDQEITDPNRVCIMGSSYGGYAALAGGAFTADKYRCVISVNGLSNIPKMLTEERNAHGENSWALTYWESVITNDTLKKNHLKEISPINYAHNFQAPTLLIYSKNDTIVSPNQSKNMAKRLKRAKKPVEIIALKGEDHWLSNSETRLAMLEAIDKFLKTHNPIN